jgi:hypothetical protein
MTTQKDYQAQVTADLGNPDDNAVISVRDLTDLDNDDTPVVDETKPEGIEENVEEETEDVTEGQGNNDAPMYSKEQVQAIIRTRVANMEKKIEKLRQAETAIDRIAEVSGLSREQLIIRLNNMSDEEQAKILGIPAEQVANMRLARKAQIEQEKQIKKLNRQLEMTELKADKRYADIDLFMDDVLNKVEEHPSLSLKDAYVLVKGELGIDAKIRDAEQRAVNSQAKAKSKVLVNPVGNAQDQVKKPDKQLLANASRVGMDANEYAAFKNIDNIDAYRAYKKAQKGG